MVKRYALGIDLGTTNTVCASWVEGQAAPTVRAIKQPFNDVDNFTTHYSLPSTVAFLSQDSISVGLYARNRFGPSHSERTVSSIKRMMGKQWVKRIDGRVWTPERVSACILAAVKTGLPRSGDDGLPSQEPEHVAITVPASFGAEQRRATCEAARLADFRGPISLFDEPAAALFHQSIHDRANWSDERRLLILDIGGGTLDASYMSVQAVDGVLHCDLRGRSRYNELGGDDVDLNLAALLVSRYMKDFSLDPTTVDLSFRRALCSRVLHEAERAKRRLCERYSSERLRIDRNIEPEQLYIYVRPGEERWDTTVSLLDLFDAMGEFMPQPHLGDGVAQFDYSFTLAIKQCLQFAHRLELNAPSSNGWWPPVDLVYLTGGSSGLPGIEEAVRYDLAQLGYDASIPIRFVDRPLESVALGAARFAAGRAGFEIGTNVKLRERMFEGVYLRTADEFSELLSPLIELGDAPAEFHRNFVTSQTGQAIDLDLFAGWFKEDPEMQPIQRRAMRFPAPLPPGTTVTLTTIVDPSARTKSLRCTAEIDGRLVDGEVTIFQDATDAGENGDFKLPPVNHGAQTATND